MQNPEPEVGVNLIINVLQNLVENRGDYICVIGKVRVIFTN